MITVYLACAMTGREKKELIKEAKEDISIFHKYGIKVHSPVIEEKVKNEKGKLRCWKKSLIPRWAMDKRAIRNSFAVVDRTADMKSEGVQHETGFCRYTLWRPVVRVSPRHDKGYFSIANLEDDLIVGTVEEAAQLINYRFGSWYKRFSWQMRIMNRCILQFIIDHIIGLTL